MVSSDPTITEQELIDFCRDRLPGFKRPRWVGFVDELSRNAMCKVLKRDLRAEFGYPVGEMIFVLVLSVLPGRASIASGHKGSHGVTCANGMARRLTI